MNKDVIYIEPEDDITDIITKIEHSAEKITVLVPPKKAGVFRSVVNIKLIAKAAAAAEKTVVLVTVDPSIIKLAAASRIPVTKDLKTPPSIPEISDEVSETIDTEIIEEDYDPTATETDSTPDKPVENPVENSADDANADDTPDQPSKKAKKAKKIPKPSKNKVIGWIKQHKIPVAIGAVALVGIIIFLIWAFAIAPAVTVDVEIQTEVKSFAENVTFTTVATDENAKEGKFYIEQKKIEQAQEVKFDATGKKNIGEKATGNITVYYNFESPGSRTIPSGAVFTTNGLSYTVNQDVTLDWPKLSSPCDNDETFKEDGYCHISGTVSVTANQPGTAYNVGNATSWTNNAGVLVSGSAIGGGTDQEVTIVEQIDVEQAKDQLKNQSEDEIKRKLYDSVDDDDLIIESSFQITTSNAEATPAAGQEVGEGVTPVLKTVTTATVYIIDKAKMEEFITEKAQLGDDQRIYEIDAPYIENFSGNGTTYSGRLKTNYYVGPKMSESEIVDMIKGKGLGDIQHDLKNITGVVSVNIETSYPWVNVAPGDTNKITVNLNVKDNGQKSDNSEQNSDSSTSSNRGQNSAEDQQK